MPLTFVAGSAADVFGPELARAVDAELHRRFPAMTIAAGEPYRAEPVEFAGWAALQKRVPQLASVDPYQAAFLPTAVAGVESVSIANAADPLHVASLTALLDALRGFAVAANLPMGVVELMQLAAKYLEDDALFETDLDIQAYAQLMLCAQDAVAHSRAVWVVG